MAATQHQSIDHIIAPPNDEKLVEPDIIKEQDAAISYSRDSSSQSGAFTVAGGLTFYPPNLCAPLAHTRYYKGYENASGKWDEYSPFINTGTLDAAGSPAMYTDNSLVFHTGYGHNTQMAYGPYSPVTTPLPSVGGDGQLYSPQQYTFSGSLYYQNPIPPSLPYITSPTPVSQPELSSLVSTEHVEGMLYGPKPLRSLGRGSLSGNPPYRVGFQDLQQSMDALRSGGSDWPGQSDRQRSFAPLTPLVSPEAINTIGSFQQNFGSVNASGQFCGVAEMAGPVDFDKSVDYWQQDKWSGQFPVKWHIIKDVPNSQFRHIVLENNDHKPVTNSRDTQEVKFDQGNEMLNIFKKYETDTSILDDFEFYEDRQKTMQERKARQQGNLGENENRNVVSDFIRQMSKSFSEVVRLEESGKQTPRVKLEKTITAAMPMTSADTN